jgi:hypothetical protein
MTVLEETENEALIEVGYRETEAQENIIGEEEEIVLRQEVNVQRLVLHNDVLHILAYGCNKNEFTEEERSTWCNILLCIPIYDAN